MVGEGMGLVEGGWRLGRGTGAPLKEVIFGTLADEAQRFAEGLEAAVTWNSDSRRIRLMEQRLRQSSKATGDSLDRQIGSRQNPVPVLSVAKVNKVDKRKPRRD